MRATRAVVTKKMPREAEIKISARESEGFLFEKYEYSTGAVEPLPFHTHSEYQFSISPNALGEYLCRGGKFQIAPLTLGIIHSGERHAPSDQPLIEKAASYRVLYAAPEDILNAAREIGWRKNELPYFKDFLLSDRNLAAKYLRLFDEFSGENLLSADFARLDFLTYLIGNFAQNKHSNITRGACPAAVKLIREYLDVNFIRAVSLDELSQIAGVGKYYLCREFRRIVGITPHLYQNHLRVNAARKLLLQNKTASEIAQELGFYDQSHFGKNFKRLVGITPQSYAASAIFS